MSVISNISTTISAQSMDVLKSILSAPQYKSPTITFADDVVFAKGATDEEFFMTYLR